MKPRIFHLDLIRATALLSIIFTHVAQEFLPQHTDLFLKMFIGSASLFFMASGALIVPVSSYGPFLRRRLMSFMPEFIIWTVFYLWMGQHLEGDQYMLSKHIQWLLFTPAWGSGWFIYAIIGLYLAAPVISPWLCTATKRQTEYFLALWLVSGLIPIASAHVGVHPPEGIFGFFYGFMGFMVAGYYLTRWPMSTRSLRARAGFWIFTGVVGVAFALRAFVTAWRWGFADKLDYDLSINVMAMCMLWFALFSLFRSAPRWLERAVTFVSVYSLGIYLSHTALIHLVILPAGLPLWPSFGLVTVAACLTAWLLHIPRRLLTASSR